MSSSVGVRWADDGSASAVADHVERVVSGTDAPVVAIPGGSTPIAIFGELASRGLDWSGTTLILGDDRLVPVDHPASNQGKLETAFAGTGATILALVEGMPVPDLDLLWLGMGEDGHIASLFPEMDCDDRPGRSVVRTRPRPLPPEAPFARLSMNMEALAQAPREIILVLRGDTKRDVLRAALADESDLPVARLVRSANGPVTVYWSEA